MKTETDLLEIAERAICPKNYWQNIDPKFRDILLSRVMTGLHDVRNKTLREAAQAAQHALSDEYGEAAAKVILELIDEK